MGGGDGRVKIVSQHGGAAHLGLRGGRAATAARVYKKPGGSYTHVDVAARPASSLLTLHYHVLLLAVATTGFRSDIRALHVRLMGAGWLPPAYHDVRLEDPAEGRAELPRHRAVEDEVDGAVEQRQDVHYLAQAVVAAAEETVTQERGE